jgi:hypothetical protein
MWAIHFKSAGRGSAAEWLQPTWTERRKSNTSFAHESLDGLSLRLLLRHSQTITDIRVELGDDSTGHQYEHGPEYG